MRLPRFRIWTLMIAVMIVGLDVAYFARAQQLSGMAGARDALFDALVFHALACVLAVCLALRAFGGSR